MSHLHKITQLAAALLIGASISLAAVAADRKPSATDRKPSAAAKALVKVNGVTVPQTFADALVNEQKAMGAQDTPELRDAVREELIRRELLMQEAKKAGIDKKPEVVAQAEAARQALVAQAEVAKQTVLIRTYVQQYVEQHPITDAQLRASYERIKTQAGDTEYKARHILVKDRADAQAIIDKLKGGEKFEDLAKQSTDPGSKDNGGDLGWAAPAKYVKPFADALAALKKGEYTEAPVESQFGHHVILLEDTRPMSFPPFEEVKPRLEQQAKAQELIRLVDDLRAKAKIE
ncbi:MAG: peptidylprolyl isomerase [Candidatus Accumulibacter sp.]|jgi:peptidyl-prolyl cis-trans isomerase C|nr:peptidylprolyl isomerase [Accumulibacter sp.]